MQAMPMEGRLYQSMRGRKVRKKERKKGRKRQLVRVKEYIRSPRRESTLLKVEKRGREEKKKEEEDGKGSFLSTHDPPVDDVTSAVEKAMKRASSIGFITFEWHFIWS